MCWVAIGRLHLCRARWRFGRLFVRQKLESYVSVHDICGYFGTAQSTTSPKSRLIRDMFKMGYFNDEFATQSSKQNDPLSKQ
ncbi:DUF6398 domain-containing protein [Paenibacillus forsythiae]|uniref:DUF6398 domain-containing protein n=1 Tax=Paenibacillus forsythiae TaxID=365616 RepID=UPI0035DB188D